MAARIPQDVPLWLNVHGRRTPAGVLVATCALCGRVVLAEFLVHDAALGVCCHACKSRSRRRRRTS